MKRLILAALAVAAASPAIAAPAASPAGTWRNARDSVRIRVAPCGAGLCGTVVAADQRARDDAAAGGTDRLIGTQLFRDFRRGPGGVWQGTVFVPDLGQEFDGTLSLENANTLVGTGCVLPGLCKSQTWTRVAAK
ncbi:DUF2147 domain-containing protein [Sphingomonas sp. RHCKR47]|uniref:DUF2147 domain-containing protein n=1 Tax=Sphingomonas citricola TaxID=2862498 RepID=UPI001C66E702|nr:DUF2147 domain-containing protein [Sphingomonas citricola]MBW6524552.1 DUF2147 domain-containing protein [Sphingomonas citricola]